MSTTRGDAPARVLLVEDDHNFRRLTRWWLEEAGHVVVAEAGNGEEGIAGARDHQPDIVLLDIRMPVMDGYEALPHILAAAPRSRVVVLTGLDAGEVRERARRLGAAAVVEKDIRPDDLLDVVAGEMRSPEPEGGGSS